jgi:predicted nucleotide-binding protein
MPERTDQSPSPAVSNRGGGRQLVAHIRFGRALSERFGTRRDDEANDAYRAWQNRARDLLRFFFIAHHELYEAHVRSVYRRMCLRHALHTSEPYRSLESDLRELESVVRELGLRAEGMELDAAHVSEPGTNRKVLVVHGRNHEVREQLARFLMKLELEPVLLDEQPAMGRTLIEKLEAQSGTSFAVVILTGDDVGALAGDPEPLRRRARQNVIFELGFSVGRLGREHVCALYEEGVELPSDIHGVEYTALDTAGAWRGKVARELYEAGLWFDPLKVID